MHAFENCFPLGLGTNRLPVAGPKDREGFESSVVMTAYALESGINYVDVSYTYSGGMALPILKKAISVTGTTPYITAKVPRSDCTADDVRRRVELYLEALDVKKLSHLTCWHISSLEHFQKLLKPGGVYDGAIRLKEEGLIDFICASLHAPPEDMLAIVESDVFEGVTLSYSLLNAFQMKPVLDAAEHCGVDVAVMNPLGGGIIPRNRGYFSYACGRYDGGNAVHAALRFVQAHSAVKIILSGSHSIAELEDNLSVILTKDAEPPEKRQSRVLERAAGLLNYCTGCRYCAGCPKGIPIASIMRARNTLLFGSVPAYNRTESRILENIQLFRELYRAEGWPPESAENPCIQCGKCQQVCTQGLNIIDGVADVYRRARESGFSVAAHRERLNELLRGKGYRRVGFYPSSTVTHLVLQTYKAFWGMLDFEVVYFNTSPALWGTAEDGITIHPPFEIAELHLDCIVVTNYSAEQEIMSDLRKYELGGISIVSLYRENDIPWLIP